MPYVIDQNTGLQVWSGETLPAITRTNIAATVANHEARIVALEEGEGAGGSETTVSTFSEFQAAAQNADVKRIILGASISVEASVTIPVYQTVTFNGYKLVKGTTPGVTLLFNGAIDAGRQQIFDNWENSEVRGNLDGFAYPEWFGLVGSTSADGEHDLAINLAINMNVDGVKSINVILGARTYYTKRPLDLRGTKSRIIGQSSSISVIEATTEFTPDTWEGSYIFANVLPNMLTTFTGVTSESGGTKIRVTTPAGGCTEYYDGGTVNISNSSVPGYDGDITVDSVVDHQTVILNKAYSANATGDIQPVNLDSIMETGSNSASSIIWIGSEDPNGGRSFFTGVEKVTVNGHNAVTKWPLKRIHSISWTGWVEEHSFIRDVNIAGFSGFGIGGESPSGITTVNGLTVQNFHIANGTRRGSIGLYAPQHSGCLAFREGTVNMVVVQSQSRDAVGGPPAYVYEWAQFACLAAGSHTEFNNIHVEGAGNAFHVFATGGGCSVSIINCDHNHLMDWGMVYYDDLNNLQNFKPDLAEQMSDDNIGLNRQAFMYHHGCGISIGRLPSETWAADNYESNVVVYNYRTNGSGVYMLRDWIYNVDFDGYGGRFPNEPTRSVNFYSRGIPYGIPIETQFSSAASHSAGAKTILTVTSSAGVSPADTVYLKSRSTGDSEYDSAGGIVVDSVPSGTEIVINKAWTDTANGTLWKQGTYYNRSSPPTDRDYFIGPIW